MFSAEGKAEAAASAGLKGSNEVTSDPVAPLLASSGRDTSCEAALCLRVLAGPAPCLRST